MTTVSLGMVAAGEAVFRSRCASSFRGFAPSKAECEASAIAIYAAMRAASADTHPKDGDAKQAPLVSGAVPLAADAQTQGGTK